MDRLIMNPAQRSAVELMKRAESQNAVALAADMGTGKTLMSVEAAIAFDAKVILAIVPLETIDSWEATWAAQGGKYPFKRIDSTKQGKANLADWQWSIPGFYVLTHQMFTRMAFDKQPIMVAGKPRLDKNQKVMTKNVKNSVWSNVTADLIIFDEVHRAQSHDSWTFKALMETKARYKIGASGTFTGNSFDGAYAITKWLWPHLAEKNIYDWRTKWAEVVYDHFAVRNQRTVGEKVPGAFFGSLPCYVMIESSLQVEVEEKKILLDLYPDQRRVYDELDARMVAWIKDNPMVVKFPMTKRIRQRQTALSLPSLTEIQLPDGDIDFSVDFDPYAESVKVDELYKILKTEIRDEPVVIYTDSQLFARALNYRLTNDGYLSRERSGKIPSKQRNIDKQDFLDGRYQIIVAVIAASGTGLDLLQTVCRNEIFMSMDESRVNNEQAQKRLHRKGQTQTVRRWLLLCRNTVDVQQESQQVRDAIAMNRSLRKKARS